LEEAGYLSVEKAFKGKRPNTTLRLTPQGRDAFREYVKKRSGYFRILKAEDDSPGDRSILL
jgi:DNA-binding PadR family transcriptional regulator